MGIIFFAIACLLMLFILCGIILCFVSQRKTPSAPLPLNGIIGLFLVSTIVCVVVVCVGSY